MARRSRWDEDDVPPPRRRLWSRFRYASLIACALLLILYIAAQAMARTAGFRDLVGQRLQTRFGLPVKIEDSSVNWRFDLTLDNLVSEGTKRDDSPGYRARRIHLAWAPGDWLRGGIGLRALDIDRCVVVFARREEGGWAPAEFQPLSDVLGKWLEFDISAPATNRAESVASTNKTEAASAPRPDDHAGRWRERLRKSGLHLRLQNSEVVWWDGQEQPRARVQGINLSVTPLHAPDRNMIHLNLHVDQAEARDGELVRNLRAEALDVGDRQILLGLEADRQRVSGFR